MSTHFASRRIAVMLAVVAIVATASGGSAAAKPMSEETPSIFESRSDDEGGPAVRLTLGGLSADVVRKDVRVTAEFTTGLKARVFMVYRDFHVMAETSLTTWRVSIALGGWRPLTNLALLAERMMTGMSAIHTITGLIPTFLDDRDMGRIQHAIRPLGRPLRIASEALDSIYNSDPGWTVGVDARGRVTDPLGLKLDPEWEVSATATLIF